MKLVDVKRTKKDKEDEQKRWDEPMLTEDYSYGLRLDLDDVTIQKLGLGDLDADETVRIHAEAFVSEDNVRKRNGKTVRSVGLQITKLAVLQSEGDEETAEAMYGENEKD